VKNAQSEMTASAGRSSGGQRPHSGRTLSHILCHDPAPLHGHNGVPFASNHQDRLRNGIVMDKVSRFCGIEGMQNFANLRIWESVEKILWAFELSKTSQPCSFVNHPPGVYFVLSVVNARAGKPALLNRFAHCRF